MLDLQHLKFGLCGLGRSKESSFLPIMDPQAEFSGQQEQLKVMTELNRDAVMTLLSKSGPTQLMLEDGIANVTNQQGSYPLVPDS